ncbi:hypothetical protein BG07_5293 [Bacillus pseudomycoides]|uniref:hypothetical protein n=1 Tax=Bacillus pseudomycoides TaxID=64104 RepID=UPI0004EDABB2|nr:hypothetical protein [Bacillus pseudomycoides]AIK39011.1 hypothetical protein DJ92_5015 [Bacillus pseudomycoides]AJI18325.1 hypothetical protein BG07_5293 [Bacillus pseudomycoides]PEM38122.1 hypothetical protein CN634_13090 [Bacillus pseudomycoides]
MYIFIGIALLFISLVFLFAQRFAPNSAMMTSFKGNSLKKFIIGLVIASVLSLSYGFYHAATYQPSLLDIKLNNTQYIVSVDIGEFGYFSEQIIKKEKETELYFASWKTLSLEKPQIIINYPSGKTETWKPNISLIKNTSTKEIKEKYNIKEIYQFSPYSFKEAGNVTLTITENKTKRAETLIKIKE